MMDSGIDFKGLELEDNDDRIYKLMCVLKSFQEHIDEKIFSEM
jgi:hypothetical protein